MHLLAEGRRYSAIDLCNSARQRHCHRLVDAQCRYVQQLLRLRVNSTRPCMISSIWCYHSRGTAQAYMLLLLLAGWLPAGCGVTWDNACMQAYSSPLSLLLMLLLPWLIALITIFAC